MEIGPKNLQTTLTASVDNNFSLLIRTHILEFVLTTPSPVMITYKKSQRVLGLVRCNLWGCNENVKSSAYTTLIRLLLQVVHATHPTSQNTKLDRVQRQAAHFCKNNYIREEDTVTKLIEELNWQPLKVRRKVKKCTILSNIHNPSWAG